MLYNKDRLLALMDKHDLAGVVAATPENVYYLSGHASWSQNGYRYGGSQVYVVFPRDPGQSPALLIPGGDVGYAALDDVWLKEIYTYGVAVTSVDAFFENTGRRASVNLTWMSRRPPWDLDAGNPCRHDEDLVTVQLFLG